MSEGVIFDIKEYALYDGPGVRETVFLKGCPLRCVWCHNPEGLSPKPELTASKTSCVNCGKCKTVCEFSPCTLCGKCVDVCTQGVRKICGEYISDSALAERILTNADFYQALSGGVTFSGGEPLMQHEFLFDVLDRLHTLHRAVETSGYTEESVFRELLERCELVIMDIKLVDSHLHQKYTGVSNERILKHYRILRESGHPHIIRMPMIPEINDSVEVAKALATLLKDDESLCMLEFLPYHKTAGAKYQLVGRRYQPPFDVNREPFIHTDIFEKERIRYKIV